MWLWYEIGIQSAQSTTDDAMIRREQRFNWDCGLTSADTVLESLSLSPISLDFTTPIDTYSVDLALILHSAVVQKGFKTRMFSSCFESVCDGNRSLPFYNTSIDAYEARLASVLSAARSLGVEFFKERVPLSWLIEKLQSEARIILLCDVGRLECRRSRCVRAAHKSMGGCSFSGHYIVLTSIDKARGEAHVLDPAEGACSDGCLVPISALEAARSAPGTDDDVIIVERV
jgi:hypothetical protein